MNLAFVAAVNDSEILRDSLQQSPDVQTHPLLVRRGFRSAAQAYNSAMDESTADYFIFVHQDVYFPPGWLASVERHIATLDRTQPNWAVLGVWGVTRDMRVAGHLYCTGVQMELKEQMPDIVEVSSLDEAVLLLRRSAGLRFDERLDGYHLYGTDICLQAIAAGFTAHALSSFCIHNCGGYRFLPLSFWRAYWLLRKKWWRELPVRTPCTTITKSGWPMIKWNLQRAVAVWRNKVPAAGRVKDPRSLSAALPLLAGRNHE